MNTDEAFMQALGWCRSVYSAKLLDYGPSWRILRLSSITDQVFIKANRLRSLQMKAEQLVDEPQEDAFIAIANYSAMAIIQVRYGVADQPDMDIALAEHAYDEVMQEALRLMTRKNHDYDEAWRSMRVSSITDIILMKLHRIKQIEDNAGQTTVSEGIESNYFDMINYAVFALIHLAEAQKSITT
ncbi:MAG TPA: DUF1599 domain-containing protein [Bacteroidales bacterium]|nr:DUF1599 domain-containing protein [Bacteroidales bacterium]